MEIEKNLITNKVALITGGSSGIGRCIAERFAKEGAKVAIACRDISKCADLVEQLTLEGCNILSLRCDVRIERDIYMLFDNVEKAWGSIDIVVTSAGISGGDKHVADYDIAKWHDVIATNLTGTFLTMREAFRRMKNKGGSIIAISSQAGVIGYAGKGAYCASKFGVRGIAHALAEEGRSFNINVSTICPGTVDTPILAASNTNVKRPMMPDAVADAAVYLASLRGNSLVRDIVLERMHLE